VRRARAASGDQNESLNLNLDEVDKQSAASRRAQKKLAPSKSVPMHGGDEVQSLSSGRNTVILGETSSNDDTIIPTSREHASVRRSLPSERVLSGQQPLIQSTPTRTMARLT